MAGSLAFCHKTGVPGLLCACSVNSVRMTCVCRVPSLCLVLGILLGERTPGPGSRAPSLARKWPSTQLLHSPVSPVPGQCKHRGAMPREARETSRRRNPDFSSEELIGDLDREEVGNLSR